MAFGGHFPATVTQMAPQWAAVDTLTGAGKVLCQPGKHFQVRSPEGCPEGTDFLSVWPEAVRTVSHALTATRPETEGPELMFKKYSDQRTGSHLAEMKLVLGMASQCLWLYSKCPSRASLDSVGSWELAWPGWVGRWQSPVSCLAPSLPHSSSNLFDSFKLLPLGSRNR